MSVFAHSLGSVIMYDLLQESCRANNIRHANPVPQMVSQTLPVKMQGGEALLMPDGCSVTGEEVAMQIGMCLCVCVWGGGGGI